MEALELTEQETALILKRRQLEGLRLERRNNAPKNPAKAQQGPKQANGWDAHADPEKVHQGRMTDAHPLFWFEEDIFKKITNKQHAEQHRLVTKLLKLPIQTKSRDRQYHGLAHMEALWQQEMLPLKYKIKYEAFIKEHNIGIDFIHPAQKVEGEKYPLGNIKRIWDEEKYGPADEKEEFKAGKKYRYAFDDKIGYSYLTDYSKELKEK